jgi:hypothetical protein
MSESRDRKISYYERNSEARRAYQRAYYAEKKAEIRRMKEVQEYLEPQKREAYLSYQRNYYFKNREKLLSARRDRYHASRNRILDSGDPEKG